MLNLMIMMEIVKPTLTHHIDSTHTGRQYRIMVSLPWGYDAPAGADWPFHDKPDKWATVYVLDGNWYTDMVAGMIRPTFLCGDTHDAIVVGIGYPQDDNPMIALRDAATRRDADLTPIYDEATEKSMSDRYKQPVPNGDAGNFFKFLQHELIPLIESTYQSDTSNRILAGHSYGGLFGLFALFKEPTLFTTYIIGSPYLVYGDRELFKLEDAYASDNAQLPATVYMFATEGEEFVNDTTLTDTIRMAVMLKSRDYEGFVLRKQIFADDNHCQVVVPGFHWGLKQALAQ